jgi:hypothetical protein
MWRITDLGMLKDKEKQIKAHVELHWNGKYRVQYCSIGSSHYNKIICLTDISHYPIHTEIGTTKMSWEQLNTHEEFFWGKNKR